MLEAIKKKQKNLHAEIAMEISAVNDEGRYQTQCPKGHVGKVFLDNLKFELLFDLGINALNDGYPREAVTSFTSSSERFFEFYWRVAMTHSGIPTEEIEGAWKFISKQSERQLGAFISASLMLTKRVPILPNPNKHTKFRNNVVHNGYIPKPGETIEYGDFLLGLIRRNLDDLREICPQALDETFQYLSPARQAPQGTDEDPVLVTNWLTAISVKHPPMGGDNRVGNLQKLLDRVEVERKKTRMTLLNPDELPPKTATPSVHAQP